MVITGRTGRAQLTRDFCGVGTPGQGAMPNGRLLPRRRSQARCQSPERRSRGRGAKDQGPAAAARYGNSAAKVSDTIGGPLDLSRSIQPKP